MKQPWRRRFIGDLLSVLLIVGLPLLIVVMVASGFVSPKNHQADSKTSHINLMGQLTYRIDPSDSPLTRANLDQVHDWHHPNGNVLQLHFSPYPIWLKIPISDEWTGKRVLEVGSPLLDRVDVYWVLDGNIAHLGSQGDHHASVENAFLSPVFFLADEITQGDIYVRIESDSVINIPAMLWNEQDFYTNQQNSSVLLGGIFGILLVMVLYNIGVWYSVRETAYLLYIGYAVSVAFYLASVTGFGYQYLWPYVSPRINDSLYWTFAIGSFMFAAVFMDHFLQLKQGNPLAHKAIRWILLAYIALFMGFMVLPESQVSGLSYLLGGVCSVLAWTTGIREWRRKTPGAKYFTIAWTLLFAGTIIYILMLMGWVPDNLVTHWIQALGITAETVLLSFALGERVALLRAKARKATEQALFLANELNAAYAENILSQANLNQQLEHKVKLRTRDLEQARQLAEQANQQKNRFLAVASHDIRQPLHALRLLTETFVSSQSAKSTTAIIGAVEHLVQLFDMLFDLSKMDNQLVHANMQATNLKRQLVGLEMSLQSLCAEQHIAFTVVLPEDDIWVSTDSLMLRRILQILIDNGIKHARCTKIDITVSLNAAKTHAHLRVSDNGIGIAEAEREKVFEEFYQAKRHPDHHRPDSHQYRGMGLGLSLAKRMGELLGSPLELLTSDQGGCEFQLSLALAENASMPGETSERESNDNLEGLNVLIVEDVEMASDALQQLLNLWGVKVKACPMAKACMALLDEGWQPDLAIIDYALPDIGNGILLARNIQSLPGFEGLPIITMSANLELMSATQTPSYPILPKPIKPSVLRAAVTRFAARY